jgi:uncharacterized Zn finger protein
MERCQKCQRDGEKADYVSQIAWVDYYRCPECGGIWTAPKKTEESATPKPTLVGGWRW